MLSEDGLDLSQLDAITAYFDLIVDATQKLDVAVGPIAREIAGLVETAAWYRC